MNPMHRQLASITACFVLLLAACASSRPRLEVTRRHGDVVTTEVLPQGRGFVTYGEAKFGVDEQGRTTVATKDEHGEWKAPVPLTRELSARYEQILQSPPRPGEEITWRTVGA